MARDAADSAIFRKDLKERLYRISVPSLFLRIVFDDIMAHQGPFVFKSNSSDNKKKHRNYPKLHEDEFQYIYFHCDDPLLQISSSNRLECTKSYRIRSVKYGHERFMSKDRLLRVPISKDQIESLSIELNNQLEDNNKGNTREDAVKIFSAEISEDIAAAIKRLDHFLQSSESFDSNDDLAEQLDWCCVPLLVQLQHFVNKDTLNLGTLACSLGLPEVLIHGLTHNLRLVKFQTAAAKIVENLHNDDLFSCLQLIHKCSQHRGMHNYDEVLTRLFLAVAKGKCGSVDRIHTVSSERSLLYVLF